MFSKLESEMKAHALEEYPKEMCALIVGDKYVKCKNVAKEPEKAFLISK